MSGEEGGEREPESEEVESASEVESGRDVVGGRRRGELVDEPEALLSER